MADSYDRYENESGGGGFMIGLLTGTVLGAGLGMLLAPKAGTELRGQLGEQAKNLGNMANEQYRKASETATDWAEKGREFVDKANEKGREFVDKAKEGVTRGIEEGRNYASGATGSTGSTGTPYGGGNSGTSGGGDFGRS